MRKSDFGSRVKKAWDAFFNNRDPTQYTSVEYGTHVSSSRPDLPPISIRNQRSIAHAVYTRISVDCSQVKLIHARLPFSFFGGDRICRLQFLRGGVLYRRDGAGLADNVS